MVHRFFDKKTRSKLKWRYEELAQGLHKTVIKNVKKGKPIPGSKIIFGQQI